MSFDTHAVQTTATPNPLQFVNIEITPLRGGRYAVAVQATLLDENELQFVAEDLANEHVDTLDQAIAVIRQNMSPLTVAFEAGRL